jgi:hypothetical protein
MPKYLSQTRILEYIQPVTHVTPTNTLCYNLCAPSFTWILHILALLPRHLQADDTNISLKSYRVIKERARTHAHTHTRAHAIISAQNVLFLPVRTNAAAGSLLTAGMSRVLLFNASVAVLKCTRNCCVRIYEFVVLGC